MSSPAPAAPAVGVASSAQPPGPEPEAPALAQFQRWLSAFNSGERSLLLAYHAEHFPYEVAGRDVADVDREVSLRRATGGFELWKRDQVGEARVAVVLKERARPGFASAVTEVRAAEPHQVTSFSIEPLAPGDELLPPEERGSRRVDAAKRQRLIAGIAREMRAHYVFPEVAEQMIAALSDAAARGDYDRIESGPLFAETVSTLLHEVSRDLHVRFDWGPRRPAEGERGPGTQKGVDPNFGFGISERLSGNVALLAIHGFVRPSAPAREAIASFMSQVADAGALIIDLRHNHGGDPRTVALVASYLFDASPVHLNDMFRRDDKSTEEFWTSAAVTGARYGGSKPIYLLTSKETISGGEELSYDLQCLGRAVVIGATTAGAANPTSPYALSHGFRLHVPHSRPINPISKTNWEGTGVVPDVRVSASAALAEAHQRALQAVAARK